MQITLEEDDIRRLSDLLEYMNTKGQIAIYQYYGQDGPIYKDLAEHTKFLREVLAQLPGTFGGERCSIGGCTQCDESQANDYLNEDH